MTSVADEIRSFIFGVLLPTPAARRPPDDADLFALGLDSMRAIQLLAFAEKRFGARLPDEEISAERLGSVAAVVEWVERLTSRTAQAMVRAQARRASSGGVARWATATIVTPVSSSRRTPMRAWPGCSHSSMASWICGAVSLAALGRTDRAREWAQRALMIDPENLTMRYNLACAFASHLHDADAAMELLLPSADQFNAMFVTHFQVDPDLDAIRGDARFIEMLEGMKARVAGGATTTT